MSAMRELELDTVRFPSGTQTHFVRAINERWIALPTDEMTTYCGRKATADRLELRKFSTVRNWCLPCYWSRHKAIQRAFRLRQP